MRRRAAGRPAGADHPSARGPGCRRWHSIGTLRTWCVPGVGGLAHISAAAPCNLNEAGYLFSDWLNAARPSSDCVSELATPFILLKVWSSAWYWRSRRSFVRATRSSRRCWSPWLCVTLSRRPFVRVVIAPSPATSWLASVFMRTAKPCRVGSPGAALLNSLATSGGSARAAVSLASLTLNEPSACSSMPTSDRREKLDEALLRSRNTPRRLLCSVSVGRSPCSGPPLRVAASY